MTLRRFLTALAALAATTGAQAAPISASDRLEVASGGRFLRHADGRPFFWQGDTGWLMLSRLNRAETLRYLDDRQARGFNVIQVMVLHSPSDSNAYGARAIEAKDVGRPVVTPGADPEKAGEYDYWDHLDWALDQAAKRGIFLALVPAWGSLADDGALNEANASAYGRFLAKRYADRPNIIWLNGGDTRGDRHAAAWIALGAAIKAADPNHLMTFHPFGRMDSSAWFHDQPWLDFNMYQSGHRAYAQEAPGARSEDNWRFAAEDLARRPAKPTLDGEPSYEGIPRGLHDLGQPRWTADEVRRYAWWSVFGGALGHTYGDNSVMQMYRPGVDKPAYGATVSWDKALDDPGAGQMRYLAKLMLSRPVFSRRPAYGLVVDDGVRYDRVLTDRGDGYLMAYACTGRSFTLRLGGIGKRVRAWWYSPGDGSAREAGVFAGKGARTFDPPGEPTPGNDWVLVLDDVARAFPRPGG